MNDFIEILFPVNKLCPIGTEAFWIVGIVLVVKVYPTPTILYVYIFKLFISEEDGNPEDATIKLLASSLK